MWRLRKGQFIRITLALKYLNFQSKGCVWVFYLTLYLSAVRGFRPRIISKGCIWGLSEDCM